MKSVLITTKIVSMIPGHGKVFQYNYYVIKFFIDLLHMFCFSIYFGFLHK